MICRINILYLKTNKALRLSDKATQFWVNKSDIVRLISKLCPILKDDTLTKSKGQIAVIFLGLISYGLGINTMLQTPTMILTPWFLVLIFSPFVFGLSFLLGFLTKIISKSNWHTMTLSSIYVSVICLTFFFKEHRNYDNLQLQLDEHKAGHYFIISTTDKSKSVKYTKGEPIKFDSNNVIYLDSGLFNHSAKRPVNQNGDDLSNRIKNYMGNEFGLNFYNPSDEEYRQHPDWSEYYLDKHGTNEESELEKMGYTFIDTNLTKKTSGQ
jgi:ABC-type multidrug transport system fused ATPase/permease subunit